MQPKHGLFVFATRFRQISITLLVTIFSAIACVSSPNGQRDEHTLANSNSTGRNPADDTANCSVAGIPGSDEQKVGAADRTPLRRLKQLTFSPCAPSAVDFGDPSIPFIREGQGISIYGSGILSWNGTTTAEAWKNFLRANPPHYENIDLFHHDGVTPFDVPTYGEEAWDVTIEQPPGALSPILYGGVMTVPTGEKHASIQRDHWSRRTFAFMLVDGRWQQAEEPLFFDPAKFGWIGHNYGHQFIEDKAGTRWFFYERVVRASGSSPALTELFMRKMLSPTKVDDDEIVVFKNQTPPYPATVRGLDNSLMEGPRPFHAVLNNQDFYFVGFSSGEWDSNHYGINLLWSRTITGPYQPYLTADKTDLLDFGDLLRKKYALTYGPGRPSFFQTDDGKWWVIFHAASKAIVDASTEGPAPGRGPFRNFFLAPARLELGPGGIPKVSVLDADIGP